MLLTNLFSYRMFTLPDLSFLPLTVNVDIKYFYQTEGKKSLALRPKYTHVHTSNGI